MDLDAAIMAAMAAEDDDYITMPCSQALTTLQLTGGGTDDDDSMPSNHATTLEIVGDTKEDWLQFLEKSETPPSRTPPSPELCVEVLQTSEMEDLKRANAELATKVGQLKTQLDRVSSTHKATMADQQRRYKEERQHMYNDCRPRHGKATPQLVAARGALIRLTKIVDPGYEPDLARDHDYVAIADGLAENLEHYVRIRNSSADVLQINLRTVNEELEHTKEMLAEQTTKVAELKEQLKTTTATALNHNARQELERIKTQAAQHASELEAEHAKQLIEIEAEHDRQVKNNEAEHVEELREVETEHAKQLEALEADHDNDRQNSADQITKLVAKLDASEQLAKSETARAESAEKRINELERKLAAAVEHHNARGHQLRELKPIQLTCNKYKIQVADLDKKLKTAQAHAVALEATVQVAKDLEAEAEKERLATMDMLARVRAESASEMATVKRKFAETLEEQEARSKKAAKMAAALLSCLECK